MKNLPAISCPKNQDCNALKTAVCCSVDLWLINAKFVNYNNWALPPVCLSSVYLALVACAGFLSGGGGHLPPLGFGLAPLLRILFHMYM